MVYYTQTSDELYHHGIKGQKWGVRRFQNKDGTRTSLGKRLMRTDQASKTGSKFDNAFKPTIKVKDQSPISPAEKVTKNVAAISNNVANLSRMRRKSKKQADNPVKQMSDEELAKRIKRLEMEKRYKELSANDVNKGKRTVEDYANVVTSLAVIAGSAASIYSIVKNL